MKTSEIKFGLTGPDQEDPRDRIHKPVDGDPEPINLLDALTRPKVRNQGQTNRCTGFGDAVILELMAFKVGLQTMFSANDLYHWVIPDKRVDSGGSARHAALAMVKQGAVSYQTWPDNKAFTAVPELDEGRRFAVPSVERITDVDTLIRSLSIERVPVGCGSRMHERATRNAVELGYFPKFNPNDPVTGYHWECIVGWRNGPRGEREFLKLGSWGSQVGDRNNPGCFWIPEHYITERVVTDTWTIGHESY